jgi:hypothetical protein
MRYAMSRYKRAQWAGEVMSICRRCRQRYKTVDADPDNLCEECVRDAKRFEQRVAQDFLDGRYLEFELFEIFDVKACRVTVTKDAHGRVLDYVEFEKPHLVYTAAEIRLFKQNREDGCADPSHR